MAELSRGDVPLAAVGRSRHGRASESKLALEAGGMGFMPPLEGAAHVIDELCSTSDETEILIVDKPDGLDLDHTLPERACWDDYAAGQSLVDASPLLTTVTELQAGESATVEAVLDPSQDPFLFDHQHRCVPLLPMVFSLELVGEAFRVLSPGDGPVTFRDIEVLNGLRFHVDRPCRVQIRITRDDHGYSATVSAPFYNRRGVLLEHHRVLITAAIAEGAAPPTSDGISRPLAAVEPVLYPGSPEQSSENEHGAAYTGSLYTGPTLRGMTEIANDGNKFFGAIEIPSVAGYAGSRSTSGWVTTPVAFDACLVGTDRWAYPNTGRFHLPRRCREMRVYRRGRDGEQCRAIGTATDVTEEHMMFDIVLQDASGNCLIEADGYEALVVKSTTKNQTTPAPSPAPAPSQTTVATTPVGEIPATPTGFLFPSTIVRHDATQWEAELVIDPAVEPLLIEHTYEGFPLLPGAAIAELFAETSRAVFPGNALPRVRDLTIEKSLTFRSQAKRRVRLVAEIGGGEATCRLIDCEANDQVLASCRVDRIDGDAIGDVPPFKMTSTGLDPVVYPESGTPLRHGEPFRCLKKIAVKRIGGWAGLRPTPIESMLRDGHDVTPLTHPGVIDGCFFACSADAWYNNEQRVELPAGFDELIVCSPVPQAGQSLSAQFLFRDSSDAGSLYDVFVYDAASQPVYVMRGFRTINKGGGR